MAGVSFSIQNQPRFPLAYLIRKHSNFPRHFLYFKFIDDLSANGETSCFSFASFDSPKSFARQTIALV